VATEAARLKGKISSREEKEKPTEKEKTHLTLTGLLMEGLGPKIRQSTEIEWQLPVNSAGIRHWELSYGDVDAVTLDSLEVDDCMTAVSEFEVCWV
jgi:hypothetical protein